jgi:hypothetical protein
VLILSGYQKDTYDFIVSVENPETEQVHTMPLSLPRVTSIIGSVWNSSFSPASWWGYKTGVQAALNLHAPDARYEDVKGSGPTPDSAKDEASQRGIAAHDTFEVLSRGYQVWYDPSKDPFIKAVCEWWVETGPVNLGSEVNVFSLRGGYAGTLDLVWRKPKAKARELTDLKTRGKLSLRTTDCIQVCAYADAYEEMFQTPVDKLSVLVAAENGKAKLYPVDRKKYGKAWIHTLAIYKELRGEKAGYADFV